jgi:hypothetical protein
MRNACVTRLNPIVEGAYCGHKWAMTTIAYEAYHSAPPQLVGIAYVSNCLEAANEGTRGFAQVVYD